MKEPMIQKVSTLQWAEQPRSQLAMDWLCWAILEDREVGRLLPILQEHVRNRHRFVGELARKVAGLDERRAA